MNDTSTPISLRDSFLVAMPGMLDPTFAGSVVYVCEHSDKGALGLVVNRPTDLTVETLFERIDLVLEIAPIGRQPVYFGGPVQTERGFVLHEAVEAEYTSSVQVTDALRLTTSKDVLEAVSTGAGPRKMLITLGYAGWGEGQLEDEIAANGWLTVRAGAQVANRILFDTPVTERYTETVKLLGFDPFMLSGDAGHA
jgi:putative transcriptional regulator